MVVSPTDQNNDPAPIFTDRVRALTRNILTPIAELLHRMGIHPDTITIFGLLLVAIACYFIAQGQFLTGVIILIIGLPLDALDGAVARVMKRTGKFGAMLDSTLDRYADGFIFAALSYHFALQDRMEMMLLTQMALIGSLLVSYTRARSEGIDVENRGGLFSRLERVVVIIVSLLIPALLDWGILLLAIGTNFTAIQRLWFVYITLKNRGE